jgi:histone H3/H4
MIKTHDRIVRDRLDELEERVEALQELVEELFDTIINQSKTNTEK